MLHEFLLDNRAELIARCRAKVAERHAPTPTFGQLEHGVPLFLDQLIETLRIEQGAAPLDSRRVSGPSDGSKPQMSEVGETAARHGRDLMERGFTIEQVVHDYGDLCQSITTLAFERDAPIDVDEYRTLNHCLDNATADAVTEFNYQRDFQVAQHNSQELNYRVGAFAHEMRNHIQTATLALYVIKRGDVGLSGATGAVLDRSLVAMQNLIDRSLAEVKMAAESPIWHQMFSLAEFIAEVEVSASLEAQVRGCSLTVGAVSPLLFVDADRDLLFSALGNLLQNAFKFTKQGTNVTLSAYSISDRILIDVQDQGEGLPPGEAERMFAPFTQGGPDRSGLGLGLSIAKRSVEANEGILSVRSVSGEGCVFTIDLPRHERA